MGKFEYLSVLTSIIIGLALANLLSGAARLIQLRARMRPHGATFVWMATLFLVNVQVWWAAFERRANDEWSFFAFLLYLLIPVSLFLMSYLVLPDLGDEDKADLAANFDGNRVWFFGFLATIPLTSMTEDLARDGRLPLDANLGFRVFFLLLSLFAACIRSARFHFWNALFGLVMLLAYIVVLFQQLR
jgi:hypothetical protein